MSLSERLRLEPLDDDLARVEQLLTQELIGGGLFLDEVTSYLAAAGKQLQTTGDPVAVGEPGKGIDGWRLTHHQARAAFAVALRRPEKVAWYADTRLLAAALQNETLARSLTQRYLRPLSTQPMSSQAISPRTSTATVAWAPEQDLEHPEWVRWGRRLGATSRVSNWWVGDWLEYGAWRWGEKYSEAAKITGYDVKTLRNIAYVARRFDLSRRRDNLTWSHHAEVAVLEPHEQDTWLDRALADQLSVADLRTELRSSQRASRTPREDDDGGGEPDPSGGSAPSMMCPHCGKTILLESDAGSPLVAAA